MGNFPPKGEKHIHVSCKTHKKLEVRIMKITKALGMLGVAGMLLGGVRNVSAVITWDLQLEFSGATTPSGPINVTLSQSGDDVILTVDAAGLSGDEYIKALYFNYDPNANGIVDSGFSATSGTVNAPTVGLGDNAYKADGDGWFDIEILFDNGVGGRFDADEAITLTFEDTTEANFLFFSDGGGNSPDGLYVAAHVGGIGPTGDDSGWVTVPETSTYVAAALLLIPILVQLRRWRRANA